MRFFSLPIRLIGVTAGLLFTGCSGGASQNPATANTIPQTQLPQPADAGKAVSSSAVAAVVPSLAQILQGAKANPAAGPGFISPAVDTVGGAAIYVTDDAANTLTVFSSTFTQTAQLTGLASPSGIATDAAGNVYVANIGSGNIVEYSRNLRTVRATLNDSAYNPIGVAVDVTTGVVGVANASGQEQSGPGNVVFYAKGATSPCATVSDPSWSEVFFDAFDAKGNLYIDGFSSSGATLVGVVRGGCSAKNIVTLSGTHLAGPGGIIVLANGDILLDDQGSGNGSTVYKYAQPVGGKFSQPLAKTALTNSINVVTVSLDRTATRLYAADAKASNNKVYRYPAAGSPVRTFSATGSLSPTGILVTAEAKD